LIDELKAEGIEPFATLTTAISRRPCRTSTVAGSLQRQRSVWRVRRLHSEAPQRPRPPLFHDQRGQAGRDGFRNWIDRNAAWWRLRIHHVRVPRNLLPAARRLPPDRGFISRGGALRQRLGWRFLFRESGPPARISLALVPLVRRRSSRRCGRRDGTGAERRSMP